VDCPLDCEFLIESRKHDRAQPTLPKELPNADIKLNRKVLDENEELGAFIGRSLAAAALSTPGAVDFDLRDALDGLIRTYRTLQSGVYYESVPANALAANIYRGMQEALAAFRQEETQRLGRTKTRDADVLMILVYLQRVELDSNNGRRRGRAFIHTLTEFYAVSPPEPSPASSLILP